MMIDGWTADNLISREALKEKAETVTLWNGEVRRFVSYETIDNVPTVEYTFEEAFQKTVCANRLFCPARPKGEWIFRKDPIYGGYYRYSECGEVEKAEKNFCPNCGSDMRRGDRQ